MLCILIALITACSSSSRKNSDSIIKSEFDGAPSWILGNANTSQRICGVGSAVNSENFSMMRMAAQSRGRTEISRLLGIKIQAILRDYRSTTTGDEKFDAELNNEQYIVDISKQITDVTLSGSEQKESWTSDSKTLYVLMCEDLEKFKESLKNMNQLGKSIRDAVIARSDTAFDELLKETDAQK